LRNFPSPGEFAQLIVLATFELKEKGEAEKEGFHGCWEGKKGKPTPGGRGF